MRPHKLTTLALGALACLAVACSSSHGADDAGPGDGGSSDARADAGGGIPGWQRCTNNGDCVLVPVSCCGSCGQPTPDDMEAVNSGRIEAYYGGRCGGIGCPACFMEPDPNLIATCNAGRCEAVDVRTHDVSSCSTDADCTLRAPECCACSSVAPVAIRADGEAAFQSLVCVGDEVCPECAPAYDAWQAVCQTGHCAARMVPVPGAP